MRIVEQLNALADEIELGQITVTGFRDQLLGLTGALDRVPYPLVKETQQVWAQLTGALEAGQEPSVDVHLVGDWLRRWARQIPTGPV